MFEKTQQKLRRRNTYTPLNASQVQSPVAMSLNREETLSEHGLKKCKCGCGQEIIVKPHHKSYGIPDYINGHNKPKWTKESRQRLAISNSKPKTEEWCKKHSEILKEGYRSGRIKPVTHSIQTRKEMSKKLKGKYIGEKNSMYGKRHSGKTIRKMSLATKGENNGMFGKKHNKKSKEKISKSISNAYANGNIQINNQFERGYYNDEWYDSSYELEYMKILDKKKIKWTKKHGIRIPYFWKGITKYYIPDFLEHRDKIMITEVKGWITKKDIIKHQSLQEYCRKKDCDCQIITKKDEKWIRLEEGTNTNIQNVELINYGKGLQFN